jgi:hypothetical protein
MQEAIEAGEEHEKVHRIMMKGIRKEYGGE